MKKLTAGLTALLLFGAASPAEDANELAWLSGIWLSQDGDRWTEESWTAPRGGMMLGVSRSGTGAEAAEFEFMRIGRDGEGGLSYWASPGGAPPVRFRLTYSAPGEALFENPAHDYPNRIHYQRRGDTLIATISETAGLNPNRWTFSRKAEAP